MFSDLALENAYCSKPCIPPLSPPLPLACLPKGFRGEESGHAPYRGFRSPPLSKGRARVGCSGVLVQDLRCWRARWGVGARVCSGCSLEVGFPRSQHLRWECSPELAAPVAVGNADCRRKNKRNTTCFCKRGSQPESGSQDIIKLLQD